MYLSSGLSGRVSELENAILFLEKTQTFLKYGQVPTEELLSRLSEQEKFQGLGFIKAALRLMQKGMPFPVAWKQALLEQRGGKLKPADRDILTGVGDILGGSDAESQISGLELTAELLRQNYKEALEEKNTGGKLYRSLGFLIGIGAAIFIA